MKTLAKLMSVLFLISMWLPLAQAAETHLAMAVSTQGDGIKVKRFSQNDLESPLKMGMKLYDKDTVITPASASCSLMFNTGDVIKVAPNSRLTVNMRPQDSKSLASVSRKLAAAFFTENPDEDTLTAIGGVRAVDPLMPIQLYPKESTILEGKPMFAWSEIPGAIQYIVTVTDSEGNVFTKETGSAAASLPYPADFPELKPGDMYFWQVDAILKDTQRSSESGTFMLATEDMVKEIEDVRASMEKGGLTQESHFLMAMAYQKHNMLHKAVEEYQKLAEQNPDKAYPQDQLGALYLKMGMKEKGVQAFAKAAALDPSSADLHLKLAKLYNAMGEPEKAKQEQAIVDRLAVSPQGAK